MNASYILCLLIRFAASERGNTHNEGFPETQRVLRHHWMNVFIFLFIPGVILICPLFTVN